MESLAKMLGHGLAIDDDKQEEFQRLAKLDLSELWRWPAQSHPIRREENGTESLLLGDVYPTVRVPARLRDFTNLTSYEAWSCLLPESTELLLSPSRNIDSMPANWVAATRPPKLKRRRP